MEEDGRKFNEEDLLRAPLRKRKTAEEIQKPRVIKMAWDFDTETTNAMMDCIGVALLPAEETPKEELSEETETGLKLLLPLGSVPSSLLDPAEQTRALNATKPSYRKVTENMHQMQRHNLPPLTLFMNPETSNYLISRPDDEGGDFGLWSLLSDEVILYMFTWLSKSDLNKCARVSKRWNRLAYDESLWRRLDLADKTLNRGILGRVLDRGVAVLRLCKAKIKTPLYISSSNPNQARINRLQFLDLSMATITSTGLQELLAGCQYLRKLSLETCQVNDIICRYIAQNRNMEVLNLCMCVGVSEGGLVPMCNSLKQLDSLNIAWTNMGTGTVAYLVSSLPLSITKLNLSGCRETLKDEDVHQLCENCSNLKELDLSDATELTSSSVEFIVRLLHHLEYLALSRCYKVLPSSLALVRHIPTILALDVFGMLKESALAWLREALHGIEVNKFPFSSIARPTTGIRRTSIWGLRVRDGAT